MTTLTTIEKAAKLMGHKVIVDSCDKGVFVGETGAGDLELFNSYTSKSDLMDVECELGIDVEWHEVNGSLEAFFVARKKNGKKNFREYAWLADHPNKFTARSHAVMAVVEQIYDERFGKDGE